MANETTTTIVNVSGNRYRIVRAELDNAKLVAAYNQIKSDTAQLENVVDAGQGALTITPAVVYRLFVFLLAVGRVTLALALRVRKIEKQLNSKG